VDGYRGGTFDEKSEMFVTFIADGSKRMRELLADLLTYTALTAEREEATGTVDLNAVLGMVRENLKSPIEDSGAVISIDSPPYVHGLEAQLVQLFQNLISNAIKYRSASPLTVRIVGRRQKGEWCFEVADNGIGIDPEYHKKIFAVFQRLHGRKIPGSGVGLAICKRVVERHGGRIWVESQPGQGSTFYFTLPAGN
jgi:light-regulated signal transduction histidine kinase (bacteriophytochrome)